MPVLVDTSVWLNHFRTSQAPLVELLRWDEVVLHPFIVTELASGYLKEPRDRILADLRHLPSVKLASQDEVQELIERERLFGQGCGAVDLTLLASVLLTPGTRLWTTDKSLQGLSQRFSVAFFPRPQA